MPVLTIENLSYTYEGTSKPVLHTINAEFDAGKIYTIIGKSGSGKSTLLSLLAGLDTSRDGLISYQGQDLRTLNRDDYRAHHIGVVFQGFNLITNTTALDNIVLSMQISQVKIKDKKTFAFELLEKVGIDAITAQRPVLKLSGGEQQRVGIARALAHNPNVIIADEPTGNLDFETEQAILHILTKLAHEENKCVIIVTHSQKVTAIADIIYSIRHGILE